MPVERCPSCRARWEGGDQCRRCGTNLAGLLAAEQSATRLVGEAVARLLDEDPETAIPLLDQASVLCADPFVDHLLAFAHLCQREQTDAEVERIAQALQRPNVAAGLAERLRGSGGAGPQRSAPESNPLGGSLPVAGEPVGFDRAGDDGP